MPDRPSHRHVPQPGHVKGPVDRPKLTIQRTYRAAPGRVFAAWTQPEALTAWFSPGDAVAVVAAESDPRPGGRWHVAMRGGDGVTHGVGGVYLEVKPDARLVFTLAWDTTPERESRVTVELAPAGSGGTSLTLTHEMFADEAARDRHHDGWNGSLARLERLLATTT